MYALIKLFLYNIFLLDCKIFTAARTVLADRAVPPGLGFGVTPAFREWYAQSDTEEMEYAALLAAARASLRLLERSSFFCIASVSRIKQFRGLRTSRLDERRAIRA